MNEITKPQMCLYMRNGIEIWIDKEKSTRIQEDLESGDVAKFIRVEDKTVNTVEIVGIFEPADLEDMKRTKRGEWKCDRGNWHARNDVCECWRTRTGRIDSELEASIPAATETIDKIKQELKEKGIVK
jgi:hypothetical protein